MLFKGAQNILTGRGHIGFIGEGDNVSGVKFEAMNQQLLLHFYIGSAAPQIHKPLTFSVAIDAYQQGQFSRGVLGQYFCILQALTLELEWA